MHQYFTSSSVSRRDFLKALGILTASLLLPGALPPAWGGGDDCQTSDSVVSPDSAISFWWCDLYDGKPHGTVHPEAYFGLPGSLMKLVGAAALLEERLLPPDVRLECRGQRRVNGQLYRCQHAHGLVNMRQALAASCNLYFAQAAEVLSTRRFLQYAEAFELNRPAGEKTSVYLFPSRTAYHQSSQLYVLGLSRTLQPSAAQLLRMTCHIARRDINGFRPETWKILQSGMRVAVTQGTARQLDPDNRLRVAAKTGTAPSGETYQSWVMGYFPYENPRVAFCGRALHGTAKDVAVPAARKFLQRYPWTVV